MASSTRPTSLTVSLDDLAQMIDHSLLHPTMTDDDVLAGLQISKKYSVATGTCISLSMVHIPSSREPQRETANNPSPFTACVKPYHIPLAKAELSGSPVLVCPVIGFPHGNSTTEVKVFEARRAVEEGGAEIDMVVNVGRVLSGEWEYVTKEIALVNNAVREKSAVLKVIFENDCECSPFLFQLFVLWLFVWRLG
jgi:deoxyribose-phosphate aldolase